MPNNNYYICFDFETSSVDPYTTQVLSIGAVAIHPKKLEIVPNSEFYTLVQPEDKDRVEAKALEINKLTMAELLDNKNPTIEGAWKSFVKYIKTYNTGNNVFTKPIPVGYNIVNYDLIIVDRLARRFKNVDSSGSPNIFHFRDKIDLIHDVFKWTENRNDITSLSFDNIRGWMGLSSDGAHHALKDSQDAAKLAIKFLGLYRYISPRVEFKECFKNNV